MLMRKTYIRQGQSISDSGTLVVDLNLTEPVSALYLSFKATAGATSKQNAYLPDDIDKIEIVDGSNVIFSMSGILARALAFYSSGVMPYAEFTEVGGADERVVIPIYFGRYIGDPEYVLDPRKFNNLQLKITVSLTISATAGFTTGTGLVDIIADVFSQEPQNVAGFIMSKNLYDWTTAGSGEELISLPTDYDYKMIMLRAFESGVAMSTDVTNVKLSADKDAFIPFDLAMDNVIDLNGSLYGLVNEKVHLLRTDGDVFNSWIGKIQGVNINSLQDLDLASADGVTANNVTLQVIKLTTTPTVAKETADVGLIAEISGYAPYGCVAFPFDKMLKDNNYLPATSFRSLDLKVTQGGAGASASVVIQQVRNY